jgi:hypothetical protein
MASEDNSDSRVGQLRPWRGVWGVYWFVVWVTTAQFLLAASTPGGNLGALGFSFSVCLVWTMIGWPADIVMLLLTPRDRSLWLPFVANCLIATIGRIWCLDVLGPILAAY